MRRIITSLALSAALVSSVALAQDANDSTYNNSNDSSYSNGSMNNDNRGSLSGTNDNRYSDDSSYSGAAGTYGGEDTTSGTTTRTTEEVGGTYLRNEVVGIRPQVGAIFFKNPITRDTDSRGLVGLTLDANFAKGSPWYIGPSTGFLFSHLGAPDANFIGTDSSIGDSGSNFFIVPANLKLGYNFGDRFRVAAHGGANLVYQSIKGQTMLLGDNPIASGSDTSFYPNVGADLEWALGNNVALTLRPDYTFTSADDFVTATLALAIPLG